MMRTTLLLGAALALAAPAARAAFTFDIVYDSTLSVAEQAGVDYAKTFWESRITGYTYDHGIPGLTLYVTNGDAGSGVAGYVIATNGVQGSVYTAEQAELKIGSGAAASSATYKNAVVRAFGQALGFGDYGALDRLWNVNGLTSSSTAYTGANALAAYKIEFAQSGATFVNIAGTSTPGVSGWNAAGLANDLLAASPTNLATATLSNTSLQAFRDLGYTVVPEPGAYGLLGAGALAAAALVRRRKTK